MKRSKLIFRLLSVFVLVATGLFLVSCLYSDQSPTKVKGEEKQVAFDDARSLVENLAYSFDNLQWWKSAIFYEIFVRSFYDSNGDGIGDIKGIIEKLDYLNDGNPATTQDLGITALWLMPIFPSPSYHGYDVTDYYNVNPDYGTLDDFKHLLEESHKRGIHVILDLVINHTSNQHPWFVAAQDPSNQYHQWYKWSDSDPGYLGPWNEQVWHLADNGTYFYGVFWEGMPDLNLQNPETTAEIGRISQYWLSDIGVDGFRLDAALHLIEDGEKQKNTPETMQWLSEFLTFNKGIKPSEMTVGEVWDSSYVTTSYLKSKSLDLVFDFDLSSAIINTISTRNAEGLSSNIKNEMSLYKEDGMGIFLTNHDMNRVMSQLGNNPEFMKHAATILLTLPGTPFMYYGEEIGMVGVKPDPQIRTPMQWTDEVYAGFSSSTPWQVPDYSYKSSNVLLESADEDSILSLYQNLIRIRNSHPALQQGEYLPLTTSESDVYASLSQMGDDTVMVVMNLSDKPVTNLKVTYQGSLQAMKYHLVQMLGSDDLTGDIEVTQNSEKIEFTIFGTIEADQNCIFDLIKQ